MGNCLVTKLAEAVNNDKLPKLGELRFVVTNNSEATSGVRVTFYSNSNTGKPVATLNSGGNFYSNSTLTTSVGGSLEIVSGWPDAYFGRGDILLISNKYKLSALRVGNNDANDTDIEFDIEQLAYCTSLTSLSLYGANVTGNAKWLSGLTSLDTLNLVGCTLLGGLAYLAIPSITKMNLQGAVIEGNIGDLSSCTALTSLNIRNCTSLQGDISVFGNFTSAATIDIRGTSLSGTLESVVQGLISNGATSGSITFGSNSVITAGGTKVGNGYDTLSWNSSTGKFSFKNVSYDIPTD